MSNIVILAADAGKYMLKSLGRRVGSSDDDVKQVDFLSKYHETNDINEECEGNSYKVVYNKKITIIGDAGSRHDFESDKEKDLHKLCTYTSITKFLEPGTKENKVYMVLACPVDFIRNKESKDSYKKFIQGDGEININVNGDDYSFTIEDVTVKAEGSGIIYQAPEKFEDKECAIIDLGGVNFSFAIYNNCVVNKDSRFARDLGGNKLNQMARNSLRDFTRGKEITRIQAEKALKENVLTLAEEPVEGTKEVIAKVKKDYLNAVLAEIQAAGYSLDSVKPFFSGGTAEIVQNTIKDTIKHSEVVKNPQWNAVQGLFVIANNKYGQVQ